MKPEFARILQGLMANRRLSARAVSRASARAESTINQLIAGRIEPTVEILRDVAPVLEISVADLLVIADIQEVPPSQESAMRPPSTKIGELVAAASFLTPEQLEQLVETARIQKQRNLGES